MKIQMQADISGTRNGEPWPARGGEIELPDNEGAKLCASGLAIPVAKKDEAIERREAKKAEKAAEEKRAEAARQQAAAQAEAKKAAAARADTKAKAKAASSGASKAK